MWIPSTEAEIVAAAAAPGGLTESSTFDAKRTLPTKSDDLATDVAAMATDGGVLLYGVGEDADGHPTELLPFPLKGARDRAAQIIESGVSEPPFVQITPIPTAADPGTGYVVIMVPASPRAPHMVSTKGQGRYYRRTDSGNVPMTEAEVAALYERRRRWESDVSDAVARELGTIRDDLATDTQASLCLVISPAGGPPDLLARGLTTTSAPFTPVVDALQDAVTWPLPPETGMQGQDLCRDALQPFSTPHALRRTPTGWMARQIDESHRYPTGSVEMVVGNDGLVRVYCSRVGQRDDVNATVGPMLIFTDLVASWCARMARFAAVLYDRCGYQGAVRVGIHLGNIHGAVPYQPETVFMQSWRYEGSVYQRIALIPAGQLLDDWRALGRGVASPFFQSLTQGRYDPFSPGL